MALEKYINGAKSKWQLGRDYEMYIAHLFRQEGYLIEYFGIEKGFDDLGRDLIIKKEGEIKIIQCKYWSEDKIIHEKHITQLYGTTIHYILQEQNKRLDKSSKLKDRVKPIFITSTSLSETAKEFAEFLGVEVREKVKLGAYPRIKCNMNKDIFGNSTYIYHLPFDQQYDRTKISGEGDFFVDTVKDAVEKGYRRAKRHFYI